MLIDPATFGLFLVACLVMIASPGPDMLLVVSTGAGRGRRAGIAVAFGIGAGGAVWSVAVAFGVANLVAQSDLAFDLIRWAGAAYLLWLAWWTAMAPVDAAETRHEVQSAGRPGVLRALLSGLAVNLGNPKAALSYAAFVPQFADPERGALTLQLLSLGLVLAALATIAYAGLGAAAAAAGRRIRFSRGAKVIQKWLLAAVFGGIAVRLAAMER